QANSNELTGPITRARAKMIQEATQTLLLQAYEEDPSPQEELGLKNVNMWQVQLQDPNDD
ncbi:hypothetical protein PSY31_22975, partial [Shigella flexneri]|nr:hypothetical protein [Shigella flexneri]